MAARQALVIGLGQFGMALCRALVDNGVEVVAVDRRADRVALAADFVGDCRQVDAMDEEQLALLAPTRRDVCVCAIGDDSRESSIIVTALLRQLGATRVLARANDRLHERILRLVGAHEVVNPEASFGERLAARLAHPDIRDEIELGDGLRITEVAVPTALVGRRLRELELPKRSGCTVVALRRGTGGGVGQLVPVDGETRPQEGDTLLLVGLQGAARRLLDRR
jgi:trk system potassium uptake protein